MIKNNFLAMSGAALAASMVFAALPVRAEPDAPSNSVYFRSGEFNENLGVTPIDTTQPVNSGYQTSVESLTTTQSFSQDVVIDRTALTRAKNFARQAAERANGGLNNYRAELSMHGPTTEAPVTLNSDGSYTFSFRGGAPGANPSVESVVTVAQNGQVRMDYNGPIRTGSSVTNPGMSNPAGLP